MAPNMVAVKGRPQPMAWNIGTMPHKESLAEIPIESVMAVAIV